MTDTTLIQKTAAILSCLLITTPLLAQLTGRVVERDGRPVILAGDRVLTSSYCDRFPWRNRMHERNKRFARVGVDLFQLNLRGDKPDGYTTAFWIDEDVYGDESASDDYATLERQAEAILEINPKAVFSIAFFAAPPLEFTKRHPEHMQTGDNGHRYRAASFASDLWLDGQCEMVRRLVTFCESRPWGNRVIGYVFIPHTEGLTEASAHGHPFDHSKVMQDAFARYLREKYQTDVAPTTVPTLAGWQADRKSWLTFTTPAQTQRYLDYFALQRDLLHRYVQRVTQTIKDAASRDVFVTVDAFKQMLQGWMIMDAFTARGDGMGFFDILLASGSYDVARSLDLPSVDGLMTPADYTARSMGWGFAPEGMGDSMVLRGKAMLFENDARSWIDDGFKYNQGAPRNVIEGRMALRRNFSAGISRGYFSHWCNVSTGFYDSDEVMQLIGEILPMRRRMATAPLPHNEHAIAMIIDDTASLYTDFTSGFQQLAVLQQRVHELARTGLPYRVYLLSDLKRDNFPRFRAYLFPNLLKVTPQRIALLREKVLRDGSIAIFGPGTGVTDGKTLSAAPASELLGMPLDLIERRAARRVLIHAGAHPAVAHVSYPIVYGDSYQFGPILQPPYELPKDVIELGKASVQYAHNTAGLILKETADAKIVFSLAMPMPAALLRSLALYGGCNPWSDIGDVVFATGNFVAVHSVKPGVRTITLPRRSRVVDMADDRVITENATTFTIELNAPDTRLFLLQDAR